jgi:hypothetical protein
MENMLEYQLDELTHNLDLIVNRMHDEIEDTQRASDEQLHGKVKALLVYRLDSAIALLMATKFQVQELYKQLKQNENEKS